MILCLFEQPVDDSRRDLLATILLPEVPGVGEHFTLNDKCYVVHERNWSANNKQDNIQLVCVVTLKAEEPVGDLGATVKKEEPVGDLGATVKKEEHATLVRIAESYRIEGALTEEEYRLVANRISELHANRDSKHLGLIKHQLLYKYEEMMPKVYLIAEHHEYRVRTSLYNLPDVIASEVIFLKKLRELNKCCLYLGIVYTDCGITNNLFQKQYDNADHPDYMVFNSVEKKEEKLVEAPKDLTEEELFRIQKDQTGNFKMVGLEHDVLKEILNKKVLTEDDQRRAAKRIVELQAIFSRRKKAGYETPQETITELKELMAIMPKSYLRPWDNTNPDRKYRSSEVIGTRLWFTSIEDYLAEIKVYGKPWINLGYYTTGMDSNSKTQDVFDNDFNEDWIVLNYEEEEITEPEKSIGGFDVPPRDKEFYLHNRILRIRKDKKLTRDNDLKDVTYRVERLLNCKKNSSLGGASLKEFRELCAIMPKVYLYNRFIAKGECRQFPYKCTPLDRGLARLFESPETFREYLKGHNITCLYMGDYAACFDGVDEVFTRFFNTRCKDYEVFNATVWPVWPDVQVQEGPIQQLNRIRQTGKLLDKKDLKAVASRVKDILRHKNKDGYTLNNVSLTELHELCKVMPKIFLCDRDIGDRDPFPGLTFKCTPLESQMAAHFETEESFKRHMTTYSLKESTCLYLGIYSSHLDVDEVFNRFYGTRCRDYEVFNA